MTRKFLISMGMALFLLMAQFGAVLAAPLSQQTTFIKGTIQSVNLETDTTTGTTIVLVTILDNLGATQTVQLSVETATSLDLVTTDPTTGETIVNDAALRTTVEIDPHTVITENTGEEETQHPVGSALANFFSEILGVDYDTIMDYHDEGVGFGVIAQALWMARKLDGDTATFQMILDAKQSGNYSAITLPDGSTPGNWGQFRKALLSKDKKNNLGIILSGNADSAESGQETNHGNGNGNGTSHGNSNHDSKPDKDKGNPNHP